MRTIEISLSDRELVIYEWSDKDLNHPEPDEAPVHVPIDEALETVHLEGYGQNLSKFIVELMGYPWADKQYLDAIIKFLRENFPQSNIDWEETMAYVGQLG